MYSKRGGDDRWLVKTSIAWMVQSSKDKDADSNVGRFRSTGDKRNAVSPLDVPLQAWEKWDRDKKKWVHQAGTYVGAPQPQVGPPPPRSSPSLVSEG